MLNYFQASVVLLLVWGVFYRLLKKNLYSSKGYFILLFIMGVAGIVLPLDNLLDLQFSPSFNIVNILLFAILLISAIIPWVEFDRYLRSVYRFEVNSKYVPTLRRVSLVLIILSLFAIIYTLPYAVTAYQIGAADVRALIKEKSLLPSSPITTVAVGVGLITPVYIIMFYLSLMRKELKKYSKFLFIGSLTYLVTSAAFQARDGFVFIPLTYYFLYVVFNKSFTDSTNKEIKKGFKIVLPILVVFMLLISVNRFYNDDSNSAIKSFIGGTWGYFYQQPFVFDMNIQNMQFFQGLGRRFELIANIFGYPVSTDYTPTYNFEWMFGTMYSSFYSATGWTSLLSASFFFVISWYLVIRVLYRNSNHLGVLLVFSLYVYFLISGLFYFRFSSVSITVLYLVLIVTSFFLKNYILVRSK